MARSLNAQLAVDLYNELAITRGWNKANAWHGIAELLLSCQIWDNVWKEFHGVVVHRESNDFKIGSKGPNKCLQRAGHLSDVLAERLGVPRADLCGRIGSYWRQPTVANLQYHNLVGHAFRSLVVNILERFGAPGLRYEEEVDPHAEFPGQQFHTRSVNPKLDILARKGNAPVANLSARWRYRHDRVDLIPEALAYAPAMQRVKCRQYAMVGEFSPSRLKKVLDHCPPTPHAVLTACVHFSPQLIRDGLGENGRIAELKSLEWLINETFHW